MGITTRILEIEGKKELVSFYPNTEPINIGDKFIFSFGCIYDIQICDSESMKFEINENDLKYNENTIDLVYGFWKRCYKVFRTTKKL